MKIANKWDLGFHLPTQLFQLINRGEGMLGWGWPSISIKIGGRGRRGRSHSSLRRLWGHLGVRNTAGGREQCGGAGDGRWWPKLDYLWVICPIQNGEGGGNSSGGKENRRSTAGGRRWGSPVAVTDSQRMAVGLQRQKGTEDREKARVRVREKCRMTSIMKLWGMKGVLTFNKAT